MFKDSYMTMPFFVHNTICHLAFYRNLADLQMAAHFANVLKSCLIVGLLTVTSSKIVVNKLSFNLSYNMSYNPVVGHSTTPPVKGHQSKSLNFKPIIGILAQEISHDMEKTLNYKSYIASSYVKFLEAAGARVVPVFIDQNKNYYRNIAKKVNGFLFPGGALPVDSGSGFGRAGKRIIHIVQQLGMNGIYLPVWGTCLGFELILYRLAKSDLRQRCKANNYPSNLQLLPDYNNSELFKEAPDHLIHSLSSKNITSNFHSWCITPQAFEDHNLNESLKMLSTSVDQNGLEYVSTIEHRTLQIYGTQWHPEKSQFEWPAGAGHSHIPHGLDAVEASQYMANFFVEQARRNRNRFKSEVEESKAIIHNYKELYLPPYNVSTFQQCYFFS